MSMDTIATRYATVLANVAQACSACGRAPEDVLLLAVSKTHPIESVLEAYAAGARDFGENYVQEGVDKIEAFESSIAATASDAVWHFIGPLQSNKTRLVAEYFDWVHSVDRLKIAQRLSEQRPVSRAPLNLCLQVNISLQDTKSGCSPDEALDLALQMTALPNVRLRGLMAIPAPVDTALAVEAQRVPFDALRALFDSIHAQLPAAQAAEFNTLSMGMSDDYTPAIAAGSTMIRVGTAIFGARNYSKENTL